MPKRVRSSPASLRIGISVPIAVVASAEPVKSSERTIAGEREEPADRVGERERDHPAERRQLQRLAADALEVDLVAGEEEQHPEAEAREELDELVRLGEAEHLGPDHDPEHDLDHDDRDRQPARDAAGEQRRERGDGDDRQERSAVDLHHQRAAA